MTTTWTDELTPAHVRNLDVYQPGKPIEELERELGITGAIKVASNENPLGPSPRGVAAATEAIRLPQYKLKPDISAEERARCLSQLGVPAGAQRTSASVKK